MINAMKTQYENERQERQSNPDYLINLLEDMCSKLSNTTNVI